MSNYNKLENNIMDTKTSIIPDNSNECMTEEFAQRVRDHEDICNYLHDLYIRKNRDYGGSVTDTFNKYGLVSFLVRIEDKLNRVSTLTKKSSTEQQVKDEKIEDTLLDLANYSIMALIELDRVKSELTCEMSVDNNEYRR